MRRLRSLAATLTTLTLAAVALAGCSQDSGDSPVPGAATSLATSPDEETPGGEESSDGVEDTYADVADPATVPLDADLVAGVEAISTWEGSEVLEDPGTLGGEVFLSPGRSLVLFLTVNEGVLAEETSQAALRYWKQTNFVTEGPIEDLEPVVVDGVEMLRARGENPTMIADVFVVGSEDVSIEVMITTPTDWDRERREERIGQVMATLELDLEPQ